MTVVICNFNNVPEVIDSGWIAKLGYLKNQAYEDLISSKKIKLNNEFLAVQPFEILWIKKNV